MKRWPRSRAVCPCSLWVRQWKTYSLKKYRQVILIKECHYSQVKTIFASEGYYIFVISRTKHNTNIIISFFPNFHDNEKMAAFQSSVSLFLMSATVQRGDLMSSHREVFSKSYQMKPKSDCIYHFSIDLEWNGRPFGSK